MVESSTFLLYLVALVTVYLTPGPDMALIVTVSSIQGIRAGVSTALGLAAARFIHVFASGLGLAALLSRYPAAESIMRAAGAGYLLLLAWQSFRSGGRSSSAAKEGYGEKSYSWIDGFVTNLLNPKALIFCSMLLPQFTYSRTVPLLLQFFLLGCVLVLVGFLFDLLYSSAAGKVGHRMGQRYGIALQRFFAPIIFSGLAVYLLVSIAAH